MRFGTVSTSLYPPQDITSKRATNQALQTVVPISPRQSEPYRLAPECQQIAVGAPRLSCWRQMIGIADVCLLRQPSFNLGSDCRRLQRQPLGQQLYGHAMGGIGHKLIQHR